MSYDYSAQPRHIKVAEAATASKLLTDAVRPGVLDVTWDAKGVRVSTCRVDAVSYTHLTLPTTPYV